jgi:hypothetical protein
MVAVAATALSAVVSVSVTRTSAQAPSLKTPWGEPDLQGIWTVETDTPFQRSPKYANQEFFTEAQRAELDKVRSTLRGRDNRGDRGSERDVAGAYNNAFGGMKRTGTRTSLIVDPPDAADHARGPQDCRRRPGFSPRPDAGDANLQGEIARVRGRQIRSDTGCCATRRASSSLQHRPHEPP